MKKISLIIVIMFLIFGNTHAITNLDRPDIQKNFFQDINFSKLDYVLIPYLFSYAILTNKGYFNSEGVFKKYNSPIPIELDAIHFAGLRSAKLADVTYLLYPGGGMLFSFKDGVIKRIDASFAQRNYYGCHFFTHQDGIYLLGGYGLWTSKNDLLKYSFKQKQWNKITTYGDKPEPGIRDMAVVKTENVIYTIGGNYVEKNTQNYKNIDKIYSLNLTTYEWSQDFSLPVEEFDYNNSIEFGVQIDYQWVTFPTVNRQEYLYVDPINGLIKKRKSNEVFESNSIPIFSNGYFISTQPDKTNSKINRLYNHPYNNQGYDTEFSLKLIAAFHNKNLIFLLISIIFVPFFIWILFFKTKSYKLNNNLFSRGRVSVELNESEIYFLSQLAKYGFILNSELLYFFNEQGKTQDLFVKRKNSMIKNLEEKLKINFKKTFFFKSLDPSDNRQSIYRISPRIVIQNIA